MIIKAYGLFWRHDEVLWNPGKGNKKYVDEQFRLFGHIGKNLPNRRIADFRTQRGIYILYGDLGPYYAGLTREQTLGKRLKDHLEDEHADEWDRFSWFGFCSVKKGKDKYGLQLLKNMARVSMTKPHLVIKDIEAILVKAMALRNVADSNFVHAERWEQLKLSEMEKYFPPHVLSDDGT